MNEDNIRDDIELLERYLAGRLSVDEKKSTDKRLQLDVEFNKLYKTLKELPNVTRQTHLEGILRKLRKIENNDSKGN
ncbi:MAG: hypothetical protein KDC80_03180 [Saprospiraceae bacterium]|nr:hypothetical protein [Saprospiraceae bacterium]